MNKETTKQNNMPTPEEISLYYHNLRKKTIAEEERRAQIKYINSETFEEGFKKWKLDNRIAELKVVKKDKIEILNGIFDSNDPHNTNLLMQAYNKINEIIDVVNKLNEKE